MTRLFYKIFLVLNMLVFILFFENCGPAQLDSLDGDASSSAQTAPVQLAKVQCEFIGVDGVKNLLINQLGIEEGDVPILDDNGNPKVDNALCGGPCLYLKHYGPQLGQADVAKGISEDRSCTTSKFKPLLELFINACSIGMQNAEVKERLFPNGLSSFESLYLTFVGRVPTSNESDILKELIGGLEGEDVQMSGACSAVASSLESVTNI